MGIAVILVLYTVISFLALKHGTYELIHRLLLQFENTLRHFRSGLFMHGKSHKLRSRASIFVRELTTTQ